MARTYVDFQLQLEKHYVTLQRGARSTFEKFPTWTFRLLVARYPPANVTNI